LLLLVLASKLKASQEEILYSPKCIIRCRE